MPAPSFLKGLPKPVLFGLYGAIGGLLGALVFGEPLYRLLEPPKAEAAPPPEPQVAVNASPEVEVRGGESNTFGVFIARDSFDDDVVIRFEGMPAGVSIPQIIIAKGKTEGTATAVAVNAALTATISVQVIAEAKVNGKLVTAKTTISTKVPPPPPPPPPPQADIIFVLDVTASMDWAIKGVADGIGGFATFMRDNKIDFRVGVVAFRDLWHEERRGVLQMEVLKFPAAAGGGQEPFTSNDVVFGQRVGGLTSEGGGDAPESTLDAIIEASKQPFRKGATKVLLIITDNPPKNLHKPGAKSEENQTATRDDFDETVKAVKTANIDFVHLVLPDDLRVYDIIQDAGAEKGKGRTFDLEKVAKNPASFQGLVKDFSRDVVAVAVAAAKAKNPETKPQVAAKATKPEIGGYKITDKSLTSLRDASVPADVLQKLQPLKDKEFASYQPFKDELDKILTKDDLGSWQQLILNEAKIGLKAVQSNKDYAPGSEGRLALASAVWTGAIASLVCLVLLGGQHHYLRGTIPAFGGIAGGLVGGLGVGLVGGAAGQGLYMVAQGREVLAMFFQIFGWALLGGLAGIGLSLFIPNLKWVHGLAGGAIGGAVGALGFLAASSAGGDFVGRLIGGLLLGLCIGLMVAIVEAAFRRAWLEVRFGPRETITVNLGPEPVKVGGDGRACTVWARGAPDLALRYFIRNGQVICEDAPKRSEAIVGNGDVREVGNVTVTVRTGSSTAPTPPPIPRVATPPRPAAPPPVKKAEPLDLGPLPIDEDPLPMPVAPRPQAAPKPTGGLTPPACPETTAAKPAGPRDPDACPSCGRKNPGRPGSRYCMMCDQTY